MLILVVPLQTDPARQKVQFYLWTIVIWLLFSVLVSFFKVKNRGKHSLSSRHKIIISRYILSTQGILSGSYFKSPGQNEWKQTLQDVAFPSALVLSLSRVDSAANKYN